MGLFLTLFGIFVFSIIFVTIMDYFAKTEIDRVYYDTILNELIVKEGPPEDHQCNVVIFYVILPSKLIYIGEL